MAAGFILTKAQVLSADARISLSNLLINFILPCNMITSFLMEFNQKILRDCLVILIVSIGIQVFAILTSKQFFPKAADSKLSVLRYGTIASNAGFMGTPIAQ
jgi:predicted permease